MVEFLKQKLAKLGCFLMIALMAMAATAITKWVLGWFHFDEVSRESAGNKVGEWVGKGMLGFMFLAGMVLMGRQLAAELRGKKSTPPPLPSATTAPPPLPPRWREDEGDA